LLDAGNNEAAERAIAEALRLAPDSCDAILQLGNAVRDRDPAGALALYRRAVAVDPRNLAARTNLAAMLGMRGDPEAEAHLRAVLAEDPWNVEAISNYGSLCLARGDAPAARQWFGRAAALAPNDPIVRRNREIAAAAEAAASRGAATPGSQSPP
jgi:Flp pilus assembly protein TadD